MAPINSNNPRRQQQNNDVQLSDVFFQYIAKWKWVLLSLLLCLSAGIYHLLTTTPLYKATSSILLKQDKDGQSLLGNVAMSMTDIGLSQVNINASNIIMTYQTPDITHAVVQRLHLNDTYTSKGTFRNQLLYGSTLPFYVNFIDMPFHGRGSFVMQQKEGKVQISGFNVGDPQSTEEFTVAFGDTLSSPLGRIVVVQNAYYKGEEFTKPIYVSHISSYDAIGAFQGKLNVGLRDKMGTVFDLTYTDASHERAIDALKMTINVYDEFWMKDKNQVTLSTVDFISQRLDLLKEDLHAVDNEIANYKSNQRIPDITATAQYDLTMAGENERKLQQLNNELSVARFLLTYMRNNSNKLLPANVGVNEQSIQTQINEYNKLSLQRSRFVESSSEENLLVKDIDIQLSALREGIIGSVENYIGAAQMQLNAYEGNKQAINARISSNPKQAGHLLSAEREQKVKEGLYLFLLQKKEEFEISQAFTAYDTRTIMDPEYGGGNAPFAPNSRNIIGLSILIGLLLPFVALYIKELMNTKVKSKKDLENLTVPFVGEIPLVSQNNRICFFNRFLKKKSSSSAQLVVKAESRDVINEAFRVTRTNVEYMLANHEKCAVIMTTSANVNSGKTFITSNLATSFGIKGKKVIAVDLDLRKASLSHTFKYKDKEGVSTFLNGQQKNLQALIQHQDIDILPAGKLPPNPAELLGGEKLKEMLEILKAEYDYIFLDCPPVEIVTDADVIRKWADMTLFVVRANLFEKSLLTDLEKYYTDNHFNRLTIVLNGTEAIGRYGYKYGYYKNGYGYGYGYEYHNS